MTSPSPRNRRTTRSSILRRSCCSLAALAFAAVIAAVCVADDPTPRKSGADLLKDLRDRSATKRWQSLEQLLPPQPKPTGKQPAETIEKPSPGSAASPFPQAGQPQPQPQPQPAVILEPSGSPNGDDEFLPTSPAHESPLLQPQLELPEPQPLPPIDVEDDSVVVQLQKPKPPMKKPKPIQLSKIGEIDPFPGYRPAYDSAQPKTKTVPKATWKAPHFDESVFEQRRRDLFQDAALYTWEATNFHHNPLYFQDPALERYGHTYPECIQPFASVGRFGVQLLGIPYQMTIDPPHKCIYTLGWYRPGECAPKLCYRIPWNGKAAAVTTGVYTGLFFLIP